MDNYIGQVMFIGFNFAPVGWAYCDGSLLAIADNEALFTLVGTKFGGDGVNNFALPDLRGRVPVHMGQGSGQSHALAQVGGLEQVALTMQYYPIHTHSFLGVSAASTANSPAGAAPGAGQTIYRLNPVLSENMNAAMCKNSLGQGLQHDNMQPYLVANWIIALTGIYPSQS